MNGIEGAFWVFAVAAVSSGYRVFRTDSMAPASFMPLASFPHVGAILLLLLAEYLGTALLFMMTVEMVVMALFMVMFMMNPAGLNPMNMVHQPRFAAAAGAAAAIGVWAVAAFAELPDEPLRSAEGTIRALGIELLGGSVLGFESAGGAVLARRRDGLARSMLAVLSPVQRERLTAAMADVERLLTEADRALELTTGFFRQHLGG